MVVYTRKLAEERAAYPEQFNPHVTAEMVAERMRPAIDRGSYHHDTPAMRKTCKELGIRHTRKSIDEFWLG
jgi:hypothetical protein